MSKILSLYAKLSDAGVRFYDWDLDGEKAATIKINDRYGIFVDVHDIETQAEELVTVAHEGGHASTGATHKVSSRFDLVEKHETTAWKWAVQELIPAEELDAAVTDGCTELWQLAEHFGVTESFMRKAVCWHTHGNLAADLYF